MFLRRSMVSKSAAVSRRLSPALLSAAVALALHTTAHAATQSSTWVGSASGNWSNPANWSPSSSYPNNGNGGFSDYNVTINPVTTPNLSPTLDVAATIDTLTLSTGAALSINSAISLTLTGSTLSNSGTLTLTGNGTLGSSSLFFSNAATSLTGGGTILLTNSTYSRIQSGNLTNVDNTLEGAGFISATVTNQSLITAQSGNLTLGAAVTNTGGNISVASTGNLSVSSTLTGGNITVATGGLLTGSGSLHNVTLTTGSDWKIQSGVSSPFISETLTNNGSITLLGNSTLGSASFAIDSTNGATLSGNGTITLTDSTYSRITGGNLTNASDTIQGAGFLSASITNNGSIIAQSGNLTVGAALNNTGGNITVASTGNLILSATLTGGNITLISGSALSGSGGISGASLSGTAAVTGSVQFTNDSLATGGNITIHSAASPQLFGNFTNQGAITLLGDSSFGIAALTAPSTGFATLNGGGSITLTNSTYSRITGGNLTNADNTIQGAGYLAATITNQGSIIAQNGNLTVAATLDNTGGNISIGSTGNLIVSAPITGGNITFVSGNLSGGGNISLTTLSGNGSVSGSVGLTNDTIGSGGNISILAAASLPIVGTLNNQGNITLIGNSTLGIAGLAISTSANVTLSGGGCITLSDTTYSRITGGNLTNLDNTIQGTGMISASLTNHGSLIAQNGNLSIGGNITNTGGNITIASTGNLILNANVTGGNITLISGSTISGGGNISLATLTGTGSISGPVGLINDTVSTGGNISVSAGASLPSTGTLSNQGTITLFGNSSFGPATLAINSTDGVTLSGGGTITLTDPSYSRINSGNLTNTDNTMRGAGMISATLISQGALIAENGNLTLSGNYTGSGPAAVTVASTGNLSVTNFTQPLLTNNGQFTMTGNGTINSIVGSGTLTVTGGGHLIIPQNSPNILQSNLAVTGANALDITNNKIILESTPAAKATIIPTLHTEITNSALTSSTASAMNTTANRTVQTVAVVDNAVRLANFPQSGSNFGGTNNVDANSILITATYLGDANLDGIVDIKDLQDVANHWQQSATDWSQGDFNGDGIVDIRDLQDIANNWQAGVGAGGGGSSESFSDSLALLPQFNTTSPVPEPASLTLILPIFSFLLQRNARREKLVNREGKSKIK